MRTIAENRRMRGRAAWPVALYAVLLAGCATPQGAPSTVTGAAPTCGAPRLPGSLIAAHLIGMGMAPRSGMGMGGAMMQTIPPMMHLRLSLDRSRAPAGIVSFVATNEDAMMHELVVIRLAGRAPGGLRITADGTADELGKVAEASRSCGPGTGDGIVPGASSWVTADLSAGRYVVLCNQPGHYAAGMYQPLTVG